MDFHYLLMILKRFRIGLVDRLVARLNLIHVNYVPLFTPCICLFSYTFAQFVITMLGKVGCFSQTEQPKLTARVVMAPHLKLKTTET